MSDDETNANLNSLNKEPAPSESPSSSNSQSTESPNPHDEEISMDMDDLESKKETSDDVQSTKVEMAPEPVVVATPVAVPQTVATDNESLPRATPGLMVLQWLTYAFWGWTVLSLAILISMDINTLLSDSDSSWLGGGVAYVLAAVIVLFIISIATDVFYAKVEKHRVRSNGTNVIMIIHAVLFALIGIGSLIFAVFGGVQLLIGESTNTNSSLALVFSGLIIAALYGFTLLRTLRPGWIKGIVGVYWITMTIAVLLFTILGVTGPAMHSRLQKQDQATGNGLSDIARNINSYTNKNDKLPSSLSSLSDLSTDAEELIDDGSIKYTAKERLATSSVLELGATADDSILKRSTTQSAVYHYELCAEFELDESNNTGGYAADYIVEDQQYQTSPSTYGHKSGTVCFDLQTRTIL